MKKVLLSLSLLATVAFAQYGLEVKATGQFGGYPKLKTLTVESKVRNFNGSATVFKKFNEGEKVEFKLGGGLELGNTSVKFELTTDEAKNALSSKFTEIKNELSEELKNQYSKEIKNIEEAINKKDFKFSTSYVSPYLAAEINGRVHENFSIYGGANLGYVHHFNKLNRLFAPKFGGKVYAGTTYKDMFSVEGGYGLYQGFFAGAGVRFGF